MRIAEICKGVQVDRVLEVKAYACPPWTARPEVRIPEDRKQVQEVTKEYQPEQVDIYVDASVRNGKAGIGIYATPSQVHISRTVANSDQVDTHFTELLAISEAANWPWSPLCMASDRNGNPVPASSIRIFSDSQSALQSVQSWRASACQEIVAEIIRKLQRTNITLHWIPGHSEIKGNERAHKLAKTATGKNSNQPPQRNRVPWYLMRLALKKADIRAEMGQPRRKKTGKFTRKIDAALHLGKSAELYQQLNSTEAAILAQLRTGKSFLKEYLYKIKASETAMCDCGDTESIAHFLFSCSRWTQQRSRLRQQHGRRFGDLSYALGGYSSRQEGGKSIDGRIEHWKLDIKVVQATIQFAKDTGRLQANNQEEDHIEEDLIQREQLQIPSPTA
jgi:ribonuclease HI